VSVLSSALSFFRYNSREEIRKTGVDEPQDRNGHGPVNGQSVGKAQNEHGVCTVPAAAPLKSALTIRQPTGTPVEPDMMSRCDTETMSDKQMTSHDQFREALRVGSSALLFVCQFFYI